jgi:hypothetical protein
MKIHWTYNAINHLVDIYDYISKDSRLYAERMIERPQCPSAASTAEHAFD